MVLFLRHYYKSILIGLVILWLSLSPGNVVNPERIFHIPHADKVGHFLAYLAFSAVVLLDSSWWRKEIKIRYIMIVVPVIFGALMEVLQRLLTTTRHAELADMIADLAGIFLGLFVALMIRRFLK